jgi:hypothetical protein
MSDVFPAMTTLPASRMRRDQGRIFAMLDQATLLLTHHGHAAGVLVQPAVWNQLLERLEEQNDLITALTMELEAERGETDFEPVDVAELKALVRGESVPA